MYAFKSYDPSAPYVVDTFKAKARKLLLGGYSYNMHHPPTRTRPEKSWRCMCSKKLIPGRSWCRGRAASWNGDTKAMQQSDHNHAPDHAAMEVEYVKSQLLDAVISLPDTPVDLLIDEAKKVLSPGLSLYVCEYGLRRSLQKARMPAKAAPLFAPNVAASAVCASHSAASTFLEVPHQGQRSGNDCGKLVTDEPNEQSNSSNATTIPFENNESTCGSSTVERGISIAVHQLAASLMSSVSSHYRQTSEQGQTQSTPMSSPGCSTSADYSSMCSSPPAKSARIDSSTAFDVAFNASLLSSSFGGAMAWSHVSDALSPPWTPSTSSLSPDTNHDEAAPLARDATDECLQHQQQQKYYKVDDIADRFPVITELLTDGYPESPSTSSARSSSSFASPTSAQCSSAGTQTCMTDLLEAYRSLEDGNALALDDCFAQPTTDFQCLAIPVCCCPLGVCSTACSNVMKRPYSQLRKKI